MSTILDIEDVTSIAKKLESCKTPADANLMIEQLENLTSFKMTPGVLKSTRIGIALNRFKDIPELKASIKQTAVTLIASWREAVTTTGKTAADHTRAVKLANQAKPSRAASDFTYDGARTGEPKRDQSRLVLFKGFIEGMSDETRGNIKGGWISEIIANIEDACYELHQDSVAYLGQIRSIKFNLSDPENPEFNQKILTGQLEPTDVAKMSSKDMASDAKKRERDHFIKQATEACQTDYQQQKMLQSGMKGMFKCGKCKSEQTTHSQAQTRSSDEPMTTFVQCLNCGNRWRF